MQRSGLHYTDGGAQTDRAVYTQGCQELVTKNVQKLFLKKDKFWNLLNKLLEKKANH